MLKRYMRCIHFTTNKLQNLLVAMFDCQVRDEHIDKQLDNIVNIIRNMRSPQSIITVHESMQKYSKQSFLRTLRRLQFSESYVETTKSKWPRNSKLATITSSVACLRA